MSITSHIELAVVVKGTIDTHTHRPELSGRILAHSVSQKVSFASVCVEEGEEEEEEEHQEHKEETQRHELEELDSRRNVLKWRVRERESEGLNKGETVDEMRASQRPPTVWCVCDGVRLLCVRVTRKSSSSSTAVPDVLTTVLRSE